MDELKKLYNTLVLKGRYNKSFEDFQSEWQNPQYQNQVYDDVSKLRLYTKDRDTFMKKYAGSAPAPAAVETPTAVEEEAVEQQPKKKDTTVLPSGVGSSASSVLAPDDETKALFKKYAEESSSRKTFADRIIPTTPATSPEFQKELKKVEQNKSLAESEFDKLGEKPKVEHNKYLNEQLAQINKDLIDKNEEFVVPEMEYRFGGLGFKFEEAGATGDWMDVTAPDGKKIQISLNNFLDSKSSEEAFKLQKFIQDNTPMKGLFVLEKSLKDQEVKIFSNQKEVDDEVAKINKEATAVNQKQKDFLLRQQAYEKEVDALNSIPESQRNNPEFIKRVDAAEKTRLSLVNELPTLLSEEQKLTNKASSLEKSVGRYVETKARQGGWLGGVGNSILEGISSIAAGTTNVFVDATMELGSAEFLISPENLRKGTIERASKIGVAPPSENQSIQDWKKTLTPEQLDRWEDEMDDFGKKLVKADIMPYIREGLRIRRGDENTTIEWTNLKQEGFWGGAILGLAKSLPAMIGSSTPAGWAQRTAQMYSQISDGLMQEMEKDPAFANISEVEKAAIVAPIGIASSVLEAYGLRNVLQSKGIVTNITMAMLGKAGRGVGYTSLRELAENEVKSKIARGALVLTAAGLAEGETGFLQQGVETGFKAIYNEYIKGDKYFQTPETIEKAVGEMFYAGAQEAIGGFTLGIPNAVSAAYSKAGFLKMNDKTFEMFENMANDETLQSAYITSLKEKVASGRISPSDAKQEEQNYRNAVGIYRQLPDGLTVQQKKEAMNLLKERKDLEQYIQGKDGALVTPQKNRINEINQELSKIAEQGATQKIQSEADNVKAQRAAKIAELSKAIEDDDTATELNLTTKLPTEERQRIEKELQDLKEEEASAQEREMANIPFEAPTYKVNGQEVKPEFIDYLMREYSKEEILAMNIEISNNDKTGVLERLQEFTGIKPTEQDAIQEQAAGQVPVQPTAGVGQEVEQGVSQAEPQVTAEAGIQEEVAPKVELTDDQIVEYNPTEEVSDKNNEVLGKVLQSKKFEPQAEPQRTDLGDSVVFEYNNFDDNETRTRFTFNKKKDGTITGVGVKVERNVGDIRNTDLFRNYVNSKRAEAEAQPEVTAQPTVAPQPTTLTEAEQLAKMEEMFAQEEAPVTPTEPARTSGVTVADPIGMDSLRNRVKDNAKKQVIDFAQKTLTTLKSVLPDFEIVIHDDENSYRNAMASINGPAESAGYFSYVQRPNGTYVGKIDINLNVADNTTIAHEVAHGIMRKTFGENTEAFKTFKNRVAAAINRKGNKALTEFASQYEENDSYEEYIVELAARLSQSDKNISSSLLQDIALIINDFVSRITNGAFVPFQNARDAKQAIDFLRNISESIKKGEAINPADITAIQENLSAPIGTPSEINPAPKGKASLNFPKTPLPLSFVTEADKIDIEALIDDIVAKKQKVWFWMADQLGRGNYFDEVVGDTHYLDAGPSFALDPANRSKGILWASGLPEKTLTNQINQADYIFFISGSPEKAKLFNKRVLDLLAERVNKTSDFNKFREALNNFEKETVELRTLRDALNGVNSFKELADSPKRKPFLIALGQIGALKTAPKGSLKELLGSFNAFIDYNELRDGFYKENGFGQNDIMLVGKPTAVSGKAPHSTYEFAISGEVVGVPDKKIDSWDIMPESIKEKYKDVIGGREEKTKPMQTKVIAAETGVIRELEPRMKGKAQLIGKKARLAGVVLQDYNTAQILEKEGKSPLEIRRATGWERGIDKKWRYEIPDGKFKKFELEDLKEAKDSDGAQIRVAKITDIFDSPELYEAYPFIKNYRIVFKDMPENKHGKHSSSAKKITINSKNYIDPDKRSEAELTIIHELQHAIQYEELFERGASTKTSKIIFDGLLKNAKNNVERKTLLHEAARKLFPNSERLQKPTKDLLQDALNKYAILELLSYKKETKEIKKELEELLKEYKEELDKEVFEKLKSRVEFTPADAYNIYYRVAGEVEARNVEFRRSLTEEQRRNTLLSETENIDRADQILFDNPKLMFEGVEESTQKVKGKAQLSSDAKAINVVKQARAQGFSENAIRQFLQGKGLTEEAINKAMATDIPAAGKITLSEETLSGYDSLMKKLGNLAAKGMPLTEVIKKLKNSKAYKDSTDVQKEKLVREVRKMFGAREKSAPKAGRLIGIVNDVTKITMTEKEILNKRLKDLAEGAKDAVKAWRKITADLGKEIKELASTGKLTSKQVTRVTTRLLNINAFNEKSVKDFIDYMANVFADAEYRDIIDGLRGKIANAKKNITSKIGIADTLRGPLNKLLSINPLLIPDAYLDRYAEIVEMLGASQQVLPLEQYDVVKSDTEAILRAVNDEQSRAYELADILENSENKVFTKGGELDYAATLKEMVKQGEITEEDADLMRKYKKEIVPQDEKQKMSEEEIEEKKKEAIDKIKASKITGIDGLPSQEEKAFAEKFAELIKNVSEETLMKLGLNDLTNLSKVIDNINKNYLPSFAYQVYLKIDGINDGKIIEDATSNVSLPKISTAIGKIKNLVTKEGALYEAVKRIPLFFIDQALGLKNKKVFNALLLKTAQAEAKYKAELKRINSALEKAEQKVASSFSFNEEKLALSKMKMMTYLRQLEFESNQGNEQVNPALDYINKTIEHIEKQRAAKKYGKTDLENLKFIRSMYQIDGQINLEKLYNSFNQAEKDAINDIQKINESLRSKAEFTSNVMRGQVFNGLNNYLHLIVLGDGKKGDIKSATDITNRADNNMRPSTKAKSLEERTKGAKPINFDVFASASRGAKYVLLDYNLTGPIKTARIALNQLEKTLDERKNVTKVQREVSNTLTKAYEEAVDNLLVNNIMDDTTADIIVEYIKRMGYRSVLAGTGRFTAELASNISFAFLAEPKAFTLGTKYANIIMSPLGPSVLENLNSTQINRIFPEDSLSGNFMDTSAMKQRVGGGKLSDSRVINKIQQLWNLTGKRYTNGVEVLSDNLISTPDKIVIRALWFGSFAQEFKKVSGKDVDFKLIGENNKEYLKENKEAIDKATEIADRTSVQAGATDNTFMGILKGASKPNQTIPTKIYNNFNSYMTRFLIFEFMSARTGVYAMMGDGPMSRTKGAMLLGAVATRMTVYSMLSKMLAGGIIELAAPLFGVEDEEEEEDDKTFLQSLGQAFIGTVGSLFFGRDFGNAVKMFVNFGLEKFNQEYLDFLRDGEYDQYEDAIAYSIIPQGKEDKQSIDDVLFKLGGSFGPAVQTARLVGENILSGSVQAVLSGDTTKKEADAIERERRVVTQRIPLEILGNAGFIPLYKDVRTVVNKSIYADLKNKKSKAAEPGAAKEKFDKLEDLNELKKKTTNKDERKAIDQKILEIVGSEEAKASVDKQKEALKAKKESLLYDSSKGIRYRNESTMKRQNPALWRKRFGPNSDWDKQTKASESVDSKLRKVREKREDKEYKEKTKRK
jgi:hypothetical protein